MEWTTWLFLAGFGSFVAYKFLAYGEMVRAHAELPDDVKQEAREQLVLALYALTGGSVTRYVGFERLRSHLGWNSVELNEALAFSQQFGWVQRRSGEPGEPFLPSSRVGLTADGVAFAEWLRAGCPRPESGAVYNTVIHGSVTDSNVSTGRFGDVRQTAGRSRQDDAATERLISSVRQELSSSALPHVSQLEARRLLDEIERAVSDHAVPRTTLLQLANGIRDVCLSAAGSGLWVAVVALVSHLG